MTIFLDQSELEELTGYKTNKGKADWLKNRGWVFEISRLGRVKVLRKYAEMQLGMPHESKDTSKQTEPNFDSLLHPKPKN